MNLKTLLFLLSVSLILGCSKDDQTTFPIRLVPDEVIVEDAVLYTAGGKTRDAAKIAQFLAGDEEYFSDLNLTPNNEALVFLSPSEAKIGEIEFSVLYDNSVCIILSKESFVGSVTSIDIAKYPPMVRPLPGQSGVNASRMIFVGTGHYEKMKLNYLRYKYKNEYMVSLTAMSNILDESKVAQIINTSEDALYVEKISVTLKVAK